LGILIGVLASVLIAIPIMDRMRMRKKKPKKIIFPNNTANTVFTKFFMEKGIYL